MGVLDLIEGRRRRREEERGLKVEQRRLEVAQSAVEELLELRAPVELRDWVVATARDGSFYQAIDLLVMKICIERIREETLYEAWRLTSPHGIEMVESYWDATWVFQRAMDRLNRTPPPHWRSFGVGGNWDRTSDLFGVNEYPPERVTCGDRRKRLVSRGFGRWLLLNVWR